MPIANASLLDEGTAAAEAMLMCWSISNKKKDIFFIDQGCYPQTIACVKTRAECLGIQVVTGNYLDFDWMKYKGRVMGTLLQVFFGNLKIIVSHNEWTYS